MKNITIIDYRTGNIGSITNMIEYLGYNVILSSSEKQILDSSHIILPGVGSFDSAIGKIHELELKEILNYAVLKKKIPILGICLGMQIMCLKSDEGHKEGFGWIDATVNKFRVDNVLKVPHMGWNIVYASKQSRLLNGFVENPKFYFVHSYYVQSTDPDCVFSTTEYGDVFISSFEKENIFATQFHPEKSHKYGIQVFNNFLSIQ